MCPTCHKPRATQRDSEHHDAHDYAGLCWAAFWGRCTP